MKCKNHPKYKGVSKPNRDCQQCWEIYEKKHPGKDTYQNFIHKCNTHKKYTAKNKPKNECKGCWDYYNWKNGTNISLVQKKYNRKQRDKKKLIWKNKKTYKNISKILKKEFIKKDKYYYDWKDNYDSEFNPYQYIISTAVTNYIFYDNITKNKLFAFFENIHKLDKKVFGYKWLEVLKNNLKNEYYEILYNEFILEKELFSSYALDEYKKFIEKKYFKNENFDFENYNLEII